jgi:MFS family permease
VRLHLDQRNASIWAALRNPIFRKLWMAAVISGTCVAAHDTAATWLMNTLTPSPFLISLLATVASLPFFLLTLPAGAFADTVDRKKLLCFVNLWLAASAAGMAVLGWSHLLNPYVILVFVFLTGVGFAFNALRNSAFYSRAWPNIDQCRVSGPTALRERNSSKSCVKFV